MSKKSQCQEQDHTGHDGKVVNWEIKDPESTI